MGGHQAGCSQKSPTERWPALADKKREHHCRDARADLNEGADCSETPPAERPVSAAAHRRSEVQAEAIGSRLHTSIRLCCPGRSAPDPDYAWLESSMRKALAPLSDEDHILPERRLDRRLQQLGTWDYILVV
jgi:hypothetical protein